ncbi:MAG: CoA transferase [Cyanobacteria bacterium RYN_339]|nr:CoA transferase [Cyanobacteria bacterium RYN_339]
MRPLEGTIVLDLTRMLPGAVLTRMLVDLGARVIKVEDPGMGDPMRSAPPIVEGVGAGFRAFMRGTESVCLDLRSPEGAAGLRQLAKQADVLIESFRPGTLERWGVGYDRLSALNAGLIYCSLSGFGTDSPRVAHDLNLVGLSGLLAKFPGTEMPHVQLADVTTGLLASSAVLAALLQRHRTHRGMRLDQPLAAAPLPFLTWAWADAGAPAGETPALLGTLLAGDGASYGVYECADGLKLVVGAIEPKFWAELAQGLGLAELAGAGLAVGEEGARVREAAAAAFKAQPREHWLAFAEARNLPVTAIHTADEGFHEPGYQARQEAGPLPGGGTLTSAAPYLPSFAHPPARPAPRLGADTDRILAEFGVNAR